METGMEPTIDIKVDAEIKAFLTPLTARELEGLKADIEQNGIREPLIIWEEECILLDGHNRYAIAQELGIKFPVKMMKFGSREEVLEWMAENQMGRRNLDAGQRGTIVADIISNEIEAEIKKSVNLTKKDLSELGSLAKKKYSKIFDVNIRYIEMARKVKQENPDLFNKIKKGEISLKKANSEISKERRKKLLTSETANTSSIERTSSPNEVQTEEKTEEKTLTVNIIKDEMEKVIDILVGKIEVKTARVNTLENSLKTAHEQIDKQRIIINGIENDMETAEGQELNKTDNWELITDGQKTDILKSILRNRDCLKFGWKGSDRTGISFINDNEVNNEVDNDN